MRPPTSAAVLSACSIWPASACGPSAASPWASPAPRSAFTGRSVCRPHCCWCFCPCCIAALPAAASRRFRFEDVAGHSHKRKAPPFGGAFPITSPIGLAILTGDLLSLTAGVRLLAARILLLLAGLLAAALLLTGLLTRVLILLARIVLIGP